MINPEDIMAAAAPAAPVAPISPPAETAPAALDAAAPVIDPAATLETLPKQVLDMAWIYGVAKGSTPAISSPVKSRDADYKTVIKYGQPLVAAGFGLYKSINNKTAVIYNTAIIHPGDLLEADRAGKLDTIAMPIDQARKSSQAPPGLPGSVPATPASSGGPAPTPASQPAPAVQAKLATKRAANLLPGSPTSGPSPGAGRILNSIATPAI